MESSIYDMSQFVLLPHISHSGSGTSVPPQSIVFSTVMCQYAYNLSFVLSSVLCKMKSYNYKIQSLVFSAVYYKAKPNHLSLVCCNMTLQYTILHSYTNISDNSSGEVTFISEVITVI